MLQAPFDIVGTLGTPSQAEWGCSVTSVAQLQQVLGQIRQRSEPLRWLGDGSNIVPTAQLSGGIIHLNLRGVAVVDNSERDVLVRAQAGNNWHQFVTHSLQQGWHGLENLALIPGSVGAVPVQNVGAYGVEAGELIETVHVVDISGQVAQIRQADCGFGYRDSRFKHDPQLAITAVDFRLSRHSAPQADYPDLQQWFNDHGDLELTPQTLFQAVVAVRQSKLPDPSAYPNVGSFFKNPVVPTKQALRLRHKHPELKTFPASTQAEDGGQTKLSAAQLIDLAGGKLAGSAAVYCWPKQPLVVVNAQRNSAEQVLNFAAQLQTLVTETFAVELEIEPQVWR